MTEDDEFTPEQIQEMARMLDPANHVLDYCHDILDGEVLQPEAITFGVATGLAEFLRDINESHLIAEALKILADELGHILSENPPPTTR